MRQYNPGKWIGSYYTQLQYTASYMTFVNFAMIAGVVWKQYQSQLAVLFPWLTFPVFVGIALAVLFVVVPWLDYIFMLRSRIIYQNSQACKHDNPVIALLEEIKSHQLTIDKRLEAIEKKG